ncbi:EAL domain-containing protein [Ruminococcus albus]|uniref:EAL domain, c-di-GMP-specific phosphodiesterase class I (Or its enzymatically inactive variant) n=1 Tax=Ruminococcus albus TaxID=1264 RepID=A0A1I1KKH9_RUMAL|nr:EAL domain-containing protein [Ruminococcus albus]SFC61279.1 EAL domain, c-di-GMP-specific phosphodiesterase class I (or its enzymatically inactive variant) [Ruminococcus albus]
MNSKGKGILLMKEYLEKASGAGSMSELSTLDEKYKAMLADVGEDGLMELHQAFSAYAHSVMQQLEEKNSSGGAAELSGAARNEYLKVQQLLDVNQLTYHFQPIVRADNGQIFAYEALMRADGVEGITPFHILKYAELSGRLSEVEEYTFLNVLNLLKENSESLHGRPVFINSIANVRTSPEKEQEIELLLEDHADIVVIEITEISEFDDSKLAKIKEKYDSLGIPIAIDDFGTGYSNISNLLRYTPNFVKIDRMLITDIANNTNKKHFVREIIDFCHENGLKALAEGVETYDELRTVILLGVDLIQGFYTARPSAEILSEIPYERRQEIVECRHELEDGRRLKIYSAEKYEKVSLERLGKEGYSCIHIGFRYHDGNVTIVGSENYDSGIHILCSDGFNGMVVLENAHLSNIVGRPCIDIGNESCITLRLMGSNKLTGGGIRVDESSKFSTEGTGDLDIQLGDADYYGIGNDLSSAHGRLEFGHDGTISVNAKSHTGVCIGSGRGGEISIGRGRYTLNTAGASSVGVGAFDGDSKIEILGCDLSMALNGAFNVGIGAVGGSAKIHMIYSSVNVNLNSQMATGVGTLTCGNADIHIEQLNIHENIHAFELTAFGALRGDSDIKLESANVDISADGSKALAFGSANGRTDISTDGVTLSVDLANSLGYITTAENIRNVGGRTSITINGSECDTILACSGKSE